MLGRFGASFVRRMSSKAEIVAPLSNRVFLFNYFEKLPIDEKEFFDFWVGTTNYVKTQDHFVAAHLHKALEPNSKFVWVNFAIFNSSNISEFGKHDPYWTKRMEGQRNAGVVSYPGQYSEISSYNGHKLTDSDRTRPDESRFLITAVTADDSISNQDLETDWTSMMKTDFIHEKLGSSTALKDSLLYRLVQAKNPLVRYTVRTELSSMDEKDGIEFAEMVNAQANTDGIKTQTGFYKVHTNMYCE